MTDMTLNDLDWKLLHILQQNARISNQDLAQQAGMSASACWRRVRALEEAGVIKQFSAIIDADKAGLAFHALLHVNMIRHQVEETDTFVAGLQKQSAVLDCFAVTGDADFVMRIRCKDLAAYNDFLQNFIYRHPNIGNARTSLVLQVVK